MRNAKNLSLRGAVVTVVEVFHGAYSGQSYTRALSAEGHRLVGPSHLFQKCTDGKVRVSPTDLMPDDPKLTKSIDSLKKIWTSRMPVPVEKKINPFERA